MSQSRCTFRGLLSTSSRQRAQAAIKQAVTSGQGPWPPLDAYRRRGGRIRWDEWFHPWCQTAQSRAVHGERHPARRGPGQRRPG